MGIIQLLIFNAVLLCFFVGIPVLKELLQYIHEKRIGQTGDKMINTVFVVAITISFLGIIIGFICIFISNMSYKTVQDKQDLSIYSVNDKENIAILTKESKITQSYFQNRESIRSVHFCAPDTEIETATFAECKNLESIILPYRLKEIKPLTFAYCKNLPGIYIPSTVSQIGNGAFLHCENLKTTTISGSICEEAFAYCNTLESIKLNKTVKKISRGAFRDCKALKTIEIMDKHTRIDIDEDAFIGISDNAIDIRDNEGKKITEKELKKILKQNDLSTFKWLNLETEGDN